MQATQAETAELFGYYAYKSERTKHQTSAICIYRSAVTNVANEQTKIHQLHYRNDDRKAKRYFHRCNRNALPEHS